MQSKWAIQYQSTLNWVLQFTETKTPWKFLHRQKPIRDTSAQWHPRLHHGLPFNGSISQEIRERQTDRQNRAVSYYRVAVLCIFSGFVECFLSLFRRIYKSRDKRIAAYRPTAIIGCNTSTECPSWCMCVCVWVAWAVLVWHSEPVESLRVQNSTSLWLARTGS